MHLSAGNVQINTLGGPIAYFRKAWRRVSLSSSRSIAYVAENQYVSRPSARLECRSVFKILPCARTKPIAGARSRDDKAVPRSSYRYRKSRRGKSTPAKPLDSGVPRQQGNESMKTTRKGSGLGGTRQTHTHQYIAGLLIPRTRWRAHEQEEVLGNTSLA